MSVLHFCSVLSLAMLVSFESFADDSILNAAGKISARRDKAAALDEGRPKIGQTIEDIGSMTIEDFLELQAVPDGMDVTTADTLYGADSSFSFMSPVQAQKAVDLMRKQGIKLPDDLDKKLKNSPENVASILNEAFSKIPAAKVADNKDIAVQRKTAISKAEETLGVSFRNVLNNQKDMMSSVQTDKKNKKRYK